MLQSLLDDPGVHEVPTSSLTRRVHDQKEMNYLEGDSREEGGSLLFLAVVVQGGAD